MKRDQFGRDLRKHLSGNISTNEVLQFYQEFNDGSYSSVLDFVNKNKEEYGFELKSPAAKIRNIKQPTKAQIEKHRKWKEESASRAAKNLSKKPKKTIKQFSKKGAIEKQKESQAMQDFWNQTADHRGWNRCSESRKWLGKYAAKFVHHIWTKGSNPAARCDPDNFIILSQEAHDQAHTDETKMKCYPFMKQRRMQLKMKYASMAVVRFNQTLRKLTGDELSESSEGR